MLSYQMHQRHILAFKRQYKRFAKFIPKANGNSRENKNEIKTRYQKVLRRVGGYNLDALLNDTLASRPGSIGTESDVNLSHLIVGSEGTLAYSTGIKLKLYPCLPKRHGFMPLFIIL